MIINRITTRSDSKPTVHSTNKVTTIITDLYITTADNSHNECIASSNSSSQYVYHSSKLANMAAHCWHMRSSFWTEHWYDSYSCPGERSHQLWFFCAFCFQVRSPYGT